MLKPLSDTSRSMLGSACMYQPQFMSRSYNCDSTAVAKTLLPKTAVYLCQAFQPLLGLAKKGINSLCYSSTILIFM